MTVETNAGQGTAAADKALEALDRAFECSHDGDEKAARRHIRTVQSWLDKAENQGIAEESPRLFELVEQAVCDMLLEDWSGAAARLDTLERLTVPRAC